MGKLGMRIVKKIGKRDYEFFVESDNFYDTVKESKRLSFNDVDRCGICSSDDLILDHHVAQEKHTYVTVRCRSCKASLNFGKQQNSEDICYLRTKDTPNGKELDWKESVSTGAQTGYQPQGQPQGQPNGYQPQGQPQGQPNGYQNQGQPQGQQSGYLGQPQGQSGGYQNQGQTGYQDPNSYNQNNGSNQ